MKALPNFRRALGYIWPQKRLLIVMSFAVLGVSTFYAVSISSALPLLHVMFNKNQPLPDWAYQSNAETRLGVEIVADVVSTNRKVISQVQHSEGILLNQVRIGPMGDANVEALDTILAVNGHRGTHIELLHAIAALPDSQEATLAVKHPQMDSDSMSGAAPAVIRDVKVVPRHAKFYMPLALRAVDRLPQGHDAAARFHTLGLVIVGLFTATVLGGICKFCHEYTVGVIVERALLKTRTDIFSHIVQLPMSWFARQQAGDTISRVSRDTTILEVGFKILFEKMLSEPLKAASVLAVSLQIDPKLMIVVLLVLPVAVVVMHVLGGRIKRAQGRALKAWGQVLDLIEEKIVGIKVLKAAHAERREGLQFFRRGRRLYKQQVRISRADSATSPLLETVGAVAVSTFILYGGYRVCSGDLEPAAFFTSAVCLAGMLAPIRSIANVNNRIQSAESGAARIFEILNLNPEVDAAGAVNLPPLKNTIEMRNVTFAYPGADRPAVCGVNFTIKAGETIAIVGPNGSGKTTLSSLLLRFFDPTSGDILIDGVDIRQATLRSLRRQIGLVTQETVIFTDTISNNISYGDPKATIEQIQAAARAAHADDFILKVRSELGDKEETGYDAIVSSRTLSGGQKQRLAIARAVLNNPPILIFDEATSQVDADSEKKIQEALAELTRGRTTLIIAHRLSTVINADRIAVMDNGHVVAVGTHQHLLETCEQYRIFCEAQLQSA